MITINSLITFLRLNVNRNNGLKGKIKIYLFGSVTRSCTPQDIDIVVVYNNLSVNMDDILSYRKQLQKELSEESGLQVDICLFNEKEAQSNPFLVNEGAVLIYGQ